MDIVVKGRHAEIPERFRQQVAEKLAKIEKLDPKVISVDVELSNERNPRQSDLCDRVELTVHSRGPVVRAEAAAPDCYAALDAAYQKLEARLRRAHDRRRVHHGNKTPVSVATATAGLDAQAGAVASRDRQDTLLADGDGDGDGTDHARPLLIREKTHDAKPISIDQALYQMELVGHDFYLFIDVDSSLPAVVYRRHAYDYGVIRLEG